MMVSKSLIQQGTIQFRVAQRQTVIDSRPDKLNWTDRNLNAPNEDNLLDTPELNEELKSETMTTNDTGRNSENTNKVHVVVTMSFQ